MADNLGLDWRPEQDFPYQEGDRRRDVISARLREFGAQAPRWRHGFATWPALGEGERATETRRNCVLFAASQLRTCL